jgi:hypothetical protein
MGATGPHFGAKELSCPCCGENGMQESAIYLWEDIRSRAENHFGLGRVRIRVNSAYRCEAHNAAVGGTLKSQHVTGLAMDGVLEVAKDWGGKGGVRWERVAPALWEPIVRTCLTLGGIGRDDERWFIHADSRPRSTAIPAQWCYKDGKEVAYYKPTDKGIPS